MTHKIILAYTGLANKFCFIYLNEDEFVDSFKTLSSLVALIGKLRLQNHQKFTLLVTKLRGCNPLRLRFQLI